jgi:hypothetical protein
MRWTRPCRKACGATAYGRAVCDRLLLPGSKADMPGFIAKIRTQSGNPLPNNLAIFVWRHTLFFDHTVRGWATGLGWPREAKMKRSIALLASLIFGFLAGSTGTGSAVVYCQYAGYPAGCIARSGVAVAPDHEPRRIPSSIDSRPSGLVRQDLFDRNNPNNQRSDWPSPPAQPGQ